jgi:hypothetical protein
MKTDFSERITFRASEQLPRLISIAAARNVQSDSEYIRRAVIAALNVDGFPVAEEQEFAAVDGDRILAVCSGAAPDDGMHWLPVYDEDAEFDAATHYRLQPHLRRDGDRVLRVYPTLPRNARAA